MLFDASKIGITFWFAIPDELNAEEKSISFGFSNVCPAPTNCEPAFSTPIYATFGSAPDTGTLMLMSQTAIDGLLPGIFKP